jgi:hypothetical protein
MGKGRAGEGAVEEAVPGEHRRGAARGKRAIGAGQEGSEREEERHVLS